MPASNLYDVVFLCAVFVGALSGRKGVAVEALSLGKWVAIVLGGAAIHEPVARFVVGLTDIGFRTAAACGYLVLAAFVAMAAEVSKGLFQPAGDDGRFFGRADRPLGMIAGAVKAIAMIVACLAVLNAGAASESQLRTTARFQREAFGSIAFPTVGTVHQGAIRQSCFGGWVREHAGFLLIYPDVLPSEEESIIERRNPFEDLF